MERGFNPERQKHNQNVARPTLWQALGKPGPFRAPIVKAGWRESDVGQSAERR
jgi:hypothetical protein